MQSWASAQRSAENREMVVNYIVLGYLPPPILIVSVLGLKSIRPTCPPQRHSCSLQLLYLPSTLRYKRLQHRKESGAIVWSGPRRKHPSDSGPECQLEQTRKENKAPAAHPGL